MADAITHSSVRIYWATDILSDTVIRYGTTSAYGHTVTGSAATARQLVHSWFLSGLAPSTTYHFSVCSDDGAGQTCSPDKTFSTSALPSPHPAAAELPRYQVDVSMPIQTGKTLAVGADCDDPATGLNARWTQANWGDTVEIPIATVCAGSYHFPAKARDTAVPHRWIVTRTSTPDSELPLPGTRITPDYASRMASVRANALVPYMGGAASPGYGCSIGAYFWASDQSGFQLRQCVPGTAKPITAMTGASVSPIVATVPNHGLSSGDTVQVSGVLGNTAANGVWMVTVLDTDRVQLLFTPVRYLGPVGNGDYAGGGMLARNAWGAVLPHTEAATLPSTCSVGSWFYLTATPDPLDGVYRCVAANTLVRRPIRWSGFAANAAINLSDNSAHHLRFIGLQVTHVPEVLDPLWPQDTGAQSGSRYEALVFQDISNDHIVWDRCWFHGEEPARVQDAGFFDGSNIAVVDSYFDGLQMWQPSLRNPVDVESAAIVITQGPGPGRFQNNHLESYGITLYATDDTNSYSPTPSDYTVSDNTFYRNDRYMYGSPTSNGKTYMVRHLFELKRGIRWLFEHNTLDGNWSSVNAASAIMLSPRPGPGAYVLTIANGAVNTAQPHFFTTGAQVVISDTTNPLAHGMWTVASVQDAMHFTLSGGSSINAARGLVNRVDNDAAVSDITIRNNIFQRVNGGIYLFGHTDGASYSAVQNPVTARVTITNNLFRGIDYQRAIPNGSYPNGIGGAILYLPLGSEDIQFRHNTGYGNHPSTVALALEQGTVENPGEGFAATDNIFDTEYAVAMSGTYFGTDALNRAWMAGNVTSWTFEKNVIAKAGAPPGPPFGPYPFGNTWHNLASKPLPFKDPANGDFALTGMYTAASSCFGTVGDCSTDGRDVGVNMSALAPGKPGVPVSLTRTQSSISAGAVDPVSHAVKLTANVTAADSTAITGTVRFVDGGVLAATAPLVSGIAAVTLSLSVGSHSLTAEYSGDAAHEPSLSPATAVQVASGFVLAATQCSLSAGPVSPERYVTLTATVGSTTAGSIGGTVQFLEGSVPIGNGSVASGRAVITVALSTGTHLLVAQYGGDAVYRPSRSPAISVSSTEPPPAVTQAAFVRSDTASRGTWLPVYGSEGYSIIGDATRNPAYVTAVMSGATQHIWISSTTDKRALQRPSNPASRIAGTWFATAPFTIDLDFSDNAQHQVALYCVDWDSSSRRQQIEILDANGVVLNTQTLTSSFNGGVYLVWNLSGHVKFRISRTAAGNAVVSGLFFGTAIATSPTSTVPQSMTAISGEPQQAVAGTLFGNPLQVKVLNASLNPIAGLPVTFSAPAAGASATFNAVKNYVTITGDNGVASSPVPLAGNTSGTYKVTATVTGLSSVDFTLTNTAEGSLGASAAFLRADETTAGDWPLMYGSEGYNVLGDMALNPNYVSPVLAGAGAFTWAETTTDGRALAEGVGSDGPDCRNVVFHAAVHHRSEFQRHGATSSGALLPGLGFAGPATEDRGAGQQRERTGLADAGIQFQRGRLSGVEHHRACEAPHYGPGGRK